MILLKALHLSSKKINNEIQNIFLHDSGSNLKNLSANISNLNSTTIIARKGIVEERKMFLFNGQIISSKKNNEENEVIKFEQLNVDLGDLATTTIKKPKIQETSTIELIKCFISGNANTDLCSTSSRKEILPNLIRRLFLPFYIPVISLICSFLLLKNHKIYSNKISIFAYSFLILLFTELIIRYTGINSFLRWIYIFTPFVLFITFYTLLIFKFSRETKTI